MSGRWVPADGLPVVGGSADRLLDATERLVALGGVNGVSSRAITLAAGHRNSSAIAYHFGDRRGLVTATWYRRAVHVNRRRTVLLAEVDRTGAGADLQALVAALVLPVAAEVGLRTPSYHARFTESLLHGYPLDAVDRLGVTSSSADVGATLDSLVRVLARLRAVSADAREPLAGRRVAQLVRTTVTSLACWERDREAGLLGPGTLEAVSADLVRTGAAVLGAPAAGGPGPVPAGVPRPVDPRSGPGGCGTLPPGAPAHGGRTV